MTDVWTSPGEWLRCALHAHTTESDGELTPDGLAVHYARAGFDVLAVTDHRTVTEPPVHAGLLTITGVELNCVLPGDRDGHVLGFGLDVPENERAEMRTAWPSLDEVADWIRAHGGVAYLAHPYWTGVVPGSLELPASITGIEVYNAGCELEIGRGLSSVHWDAWLEGGRLCPAIATDDTHHPGFDSGFSWTWVRAAERTAKAVLAALAAGRCYGSCGPELHDVRREDGAVVVRCSPARSLTLVSVPRVGAAVNAGRLGYTYDAEVLERDSAGSITAARLLLAGLGGYARLEIADEAGRRAWTNPIAV